MRFDGRFIHSTITALDISLLENQPPRCCSSDTGKNSMIHLCLFYKVNNPRSILIYSRVNCPCPEQCRNPNSQLSSARFAPTLRTEPKDHDHTIHRVPVNGLIVILRFLFLFLVVIYRRYIAQCRLKSVRFTTSRKINSLIGLRN